MLQGGDGSRLKKPAFPIVLSGPAGAGKGVLGARLLQADQDVVFSVSATTRPPRAHEKEGVNYFFVTEEEFRGMIEADELVEWARVHDHLYGTPASYLDRHLAESRCVLLDIDVQGGASVMKRYPDALSVFVVPPSLEILTQRLTGRGTEDASALKTRLSNATEEMKAAVDYQYLVINDDLDTAANALVSIVRAERCRLSRISEGGVRLL